jgi:DNA primase
MRTTLDDLLQRVNILDVVSQYVKLRKAGKDYAGLCPFHKEKTPSFTVSVEKQMFYCFSCREGGNAVNFLMKYENLSFHEAGKPCATIWHGDHTKRQRKTDRPL